ncbi:signal peptidase I [Kordiimonas pumila]|uniref:Signal peptidase I n=1 Tax=Kordiimonas pumila TaxID=2161677 RepID=A0ABV7D6X9_9PROT|nr:signal peptidase I [Kordiimonas pumila]
MITAFLFAALMLFPEEDTCTTTETTISGNSMQGLLWDKQNITVYSFGCDTPSRYDYILFTHPETPNAVVKQLWGLPGDILRVEDDGHFYINDVMVMTPFSKPYLLLGAYKTRFKEIEGILDGYMLLGHPGSLDSARVGLLPESSFLGYVKKAEPYDGH